MSIDCVFNLRYSSRHAVMFLPSFHIAGPTMQLYVPLVSITTACLYPPMSLLDHTKAPVIPTSDNIIEHSKRLDATSVLSVPSFLERWSSEPDSLEWLKTLSFVVSMFASQDSVPDYSPSFRLMEADLSPLKQATLLRRLA